MKIGMIFEGGACRSAFSAGVMEAFLDQDIRGDYLIGVSAGACYMVSYASGQKGRNKELVLRYIPDRRYMGPKYLSKRRNRSYFNLDFITFRTGAQATLRHQKSEVENQLNLVVFLLITEK